MARLNKKELRLLVAFVATLFFAVNVIALNRYLAGVRTARAQLRAVAEKRQEIDALLSDRDYWEERKEWLEKHQPVLGNVGAAQGELIAALQRLARDRGITILEQTILEPAFKPQYRLVLVKMKVIAPMREMIEWLAEIQSPNEFYVVNQISLGIDMKSREQEIPALCTVQVGRLYSPKGEQKGESR